MTPSFCLPCGKGQSSDRAPGGKAAVRGMNCRSLATAVVPLTFSRIINYKQNPGREAELNTVFGALLPIRCSAPPWPTLAAGSARIGDLTIPFAISLPTISRHLKALE